MLVLTLHFNFLPHHLNLIKMKKLMHFSNLKFLPITIFVVFNCLVSCSKQTTTTTPTPTPTTSSSFTWTVNGGSTIMTADSARFSAQYKTIFAYKKTGATYALQYEINLTAGIPATYTLGTANAITYTGNTPYFIPTTGDVIITANSGTKLSGTFQGSGTAAGGTSSISGTFKDIPVQ